MLAALATQTQRIHVITLVSPIPFHNPAILARRALTVDHISNGRLVVGLGTDGHGFCGHAMTGIPDWSVRERVDRFSEFVAIVDQLLRHDVASYAGRHYTIRDAVVTPSTIQQPRPPILIAAMGLRMLRHAAQYADVWTTMGTNPSWRPSSLDERVGAVRQQIERLNGYCRTLGRDPRTIRRQVLLIDPGMYRDQLRLNYYASIDAFEDVVKRYQALGIDECIVYYPLNEDQLPMFRQIARDVIPQNQKGG